MRRHSLVIAAFLAAILAGCGNTTPAWQLDNDRIIAVRATPPHVPAGGHATLDVLITAMGAGPSMVSPSLAGPVPASPATPVPAALAGAVVNDAGTWTVTAPDEPTLAAVRAELGLAAGAPIALRVGITAAFAAGPLVAVKTVTLGDTGDNPELGDVTVADLPAHDGMSVPADTDVALHVAAADTDTVDWFTSIGDLSDDTDADATLNHDTTKTDPPEPTSGHLAVVKRDATGGVTWAFWTIAVAP